MDSGIHLGDRYSPGLALGDLDGDGDLDVFLVHGETWREQGGGLANELWTNERLEIYGLQYSHIKRIADLV